MISLQTLFELCNHPSNATVVIVVVLVLGVILPHAYNIFLHPLRNYPGPKLWAASRLPYAIHDARGTLHHKMLAVHKRYGPIVRVSPDELSYTSETAWATIYGNRPGQPEMLKARQLPRLKTGSRSVVTISDTPSHRQRRGLLQYAFTEDALRQQEHFIQHYAKLLVQKLQCKAWAGPIDLVPWLNWTTFDILGEVAFGEPFGALESTQNHPWVSAVFQMLKFVPLFQAINYYGLAPFVKYVTPKKRLDGWSNVQKFCGQVMGRRLGKADTDDRKDFTYFMRQARKGYKLDNSELTSEANTLVVAGSETSATALAGALYFLLTSPDAYHLARQEVREAFNKENQITMLSTSKLPYLHAVLNESMRMYPPAVATFPRTVPGSGEMIDGQWVPGKVAVGIHHLSAYHSSLNWARANEFLPERWIGFEDKQSEFHNDKRGALQPFSYGPRNCLGKGMAWAEMNIIMAKLLWAFDMKLDESAKDWTKQKIYLVWEKKPLRVKLTPAGASE